jgi:hypothetical protein
LDGKENFEVSERRGVVFVDDAATMDFGAGYRDRPLRFLWRVTPALTQLLGLPAARNSAFEATRCAILAEALLGAESGQDVSYSRRKVSYVSGKRYRAADHTYSTVLGSVAELEREGWLSGHCVEPNNLGWQSSFWATPDLIQAADSFAAVLKFQGREPIRLKDDARHLVDYTETRKTLRLRKALERINARLKELNIELPGAVRQGRHLRIDGAYILPIPGNGLHRVFNRGSFAYGGRAFGWWQNIPKTARCDLLIDGDATAVADYTALHAAILYNEHGQKFVGDPYDVGKFRRDHIKAGFNIAVNAPNRTSAVYALADRIGRSRSDASQILTAIDKRHQPISNAFCSDAGVRLMRIDSELILRALKASNDDGIPALPVHDALIAPIQSIDRVAENMVEAFETLIGRVNPCQIKIKGIKVPHMGEVGGTSPGSLLQAA